jgi:hypothetical protein
MAATDLAGLAAGSSSERISNTLLALRESGAHHFDPPRFRFIEAMLHRSRRHSDPVASRLLERAESALRAYEQQLQAARGGVSRPVARHGELYPQSAATRLQRQANNLHQRKPNRRLGDLLDRLDQPEEPAAIYREANGLEHLLLQQEQQALAATVVGGDATAQPSGDAVRDLRAAHWLRKSRAGRRTREVLAEALQDCHENSGPLNPGMLAIRALEGLQELSPAYLQHMVSYTDTVFSLRDSGPGFARQSPAGRRSGAAQRSRS